MTPLNETMARVLRSGAAALVALAVAAAGCAEERSPVDTASCRPGSPGCDAAHATDEHGGGDAGHDDGHDEEHGAEHAHGEEKGDDHGGETVRLRAADLEPHGVTIAVAGPGSIDLGVDLPAEVRPNGERLAHIVSRFPGIARDVRKSVGDVVRAGDVLAVIESSETLALFELKTMLDGTVISRHITRGEAVDRERSSFVIADLSTVWVDMSVYQKDVAHVRLGQRVRITAGHGHGGTQRTEGAISYITPIVDEATRTATARIVVANTDGVWRPGMFVTARVIDPVDVDIAVPRTSIQTVGGRPVVFVETKEGFAPRPVTLGRGGDDDVEIVTGLHAGDRYAATTTFLLKAELAKGEAEHAH